MQALTKGSKREEPTMRGLRLTMMGISLLLIGLSSVIWYQSLSVVDYTTKQTSSLHYLGKRLVLLQKIGAQVLTLQAAALEVSAVVCAYRAASALRGEFRREGGVSAVVVHTVQPRRFGVNSDGRVGLRSGAHPSG
jgi:hypothetical protein